MVTYEVYDTKKKKIVFKGNATDTADMLYIEKSTLYALANGYSKGKLCHRRFLVKSKGERKYGGEYLVYDISNLPEKLNLIFIGTIKDISEKFGDSYYNVNRCLKRHWVYKNRYLIKPVKNKKDYRGITNGELFKELFGKDIWTLFDELTSNSDLLEKWENERNRNF